MADRILVAYATKCGSTAEVAAAIGQVFSQALVPVDVRKMKDVKDLGPYQAVILGTAIRMEKPLPEATKFADRYDLDLKRLPVACFSLGVEMREDQDLSGSPF